MSGPLIPWDSQRMDHNKLVWRSKLDNRYLIEVQRTGSHTADLCVFDHDNGDKEIARWPVPLNYGAMFGPDVDDAADWQNKVIDFVDNVYSKK